MIPRDAITGIVLCGGRARRMGGVEKALLPLQGRPLVAHVFERLQPQVITVLISANREVPAYAVYRVPVVPDRIADQGPLGGLQAALHHVHTPWFFCCPGDAPFLDRQIVQCLAAHIGSPDVTMVYPHDGAQPQHLFLLGHTTLATALDTYLNSGQRSVRGFVDTQAAHAVHVPDIVSSFRNINVPADLSAANRDSH